MPSEDDFNSQNDYQDSELFKKATEILKQATNTLNMTTDKFLSSQPLKNEDSKKELQEIIKAI